MALAKKRKITEVDDIEGYSSMTAPQKKVARKAAAASKHAIEYERDLKLRLEKIKRPTRNRFSDLPGELRNKIYDLSIGRSVQTKAQSRSEWREGVVPEAGLLRVSKAIRAEAGSLYYSGTVFEVYFTSTECGDACAWALQKLQLWTPRQRRNARLHFTSVTWKDMGGWMSLAKLIFNLDLGSRKKKRLSVAWKKMLIDNSGADFMHGFRNANLHMSLNHLIDFSVAYKIKGMSEAELETSFLEWASMTIDQRPRLIASSETRQAAALSLKKVAMTTRAGDNLAQRLAKVKENLERMARPRPTFSLFGFPRF